MYIPTYIMGVYKMEKEDVKIDRKKALGKKASVQINIRITESISKWLKENQISPTAVFLLAIKELGYKKNG